MADLPTPEEVEENQKLGEEYEHPEQETPEGGCSNLGEAPEDIDAEDTEDDGEDDGEGGI